MVATTRHKLIRHLAVLFIWVAAAISLTSPGRDPKSDFEYDDQINQIYSACVLEMLRSTCRVANDKSPMPSVFVAGVGQIDAVSYQSLRAAGDAMCTLVRDGCTKDWAGPACRTSRSLWMN
jgi:hypothetical protein